MKGTGTPKDNKCNLSTKWMLATDLLVADGLVKVLVFLDHHLDLLLLAVHLVRLQEVLPVRHPVLGLLAVPKKNTTLLGTEM
jgi:hypothetical protein